MDTSTPRDPSTPDPSEFDGGQPDVPADESPDVLFPDTLAPRAYQEALPRGDVRDVLEQQTETGPLAEEEDAPRE